MTQHAAASHRARGWKLEAERANQALELEISRHCETGRRLTEARADLLLSRAAGEISRAEAAEGRKLRAELVAMLKRHGIEV